MQVRGLSTDPTRSSRQLPQLINRQLSAMSNPSGRDAFYPSTETHPFFSLTPQVQKMNTSDMTACAHLPTTRSVSRLDFLSDDKPLFRLLSVPYVCHDACWSFHDFELCSWIIHGGGLMREQIVEPQHCGLQILLSLNSVRLEGHLHSDNIKLLLPDHIILA